MNWVDIAILVTIVWFTYAAFHAGVIREVITIVGAVFAVALAGIFYADFAQDIEIAIDDPQTAEIVAFGIIFGSVVLASQLVALFLKQAASLLMLGLADSMGGAIFGFLKGCVFVELGLIAAITFESLGLQESIDRSALAPFFLDFAPVLRFILPGKFKDAIDSF